MWDSIRITTSTSKLKKAILKTRVKSKARRRMLRDPRSKAKFDFLLQWLDIEKSYPVSSKPPDFSPALAMDLKSSLLRSIERTVWKEKGHWQVFGLSSGEVTEPVAKYCKFPSEQTKPKWVCHSERVRLWPIWHPYPSYVLASHSYPEDSSPIHRGVFTIAKSLGMLRPRKNNLL